MYSLTAVLWWSTVDVEKIRKLENAAGKERSTFPIRTVEVNPSIEKMTI